ncbi:hypothetical protein [Sporolactobacillus spathodeae]|uniref:DUF1453 domain-containing protein n=1 Tax=Sporolactobacillus spathodeae TaxID=1465502 RepID=A0ABS2Q4N7_9BACL|nr:hypothetical protein [Sporolactobacillus spathodeae]MBM7656738.1 hypothetical protein [Sporolactobacillus spathodeae]
MLLLLSSLIAMIVLFSQLREKPLTGRLYRQPIALFLFVCIALSFRPLITAADWCVLGGALLTSFGLGLLQGRYTPLVHHDGAWYLSGSILAVLIWLTSIPVRYALNAIANLFLSLNPTLTGSSAFIVYFTFIGGLLAGRYSMLFFRYPSLLKTVGGNERKLKRMQTR